MLKVRAHYAWGVLGLAVLVVLFQVISSALGRTFYLTQMTMAAYYSIAVLGLCFLMGYAGQVSLGHAGFFAIGGYTSALLTTWDVSGTWGQGNLAAGLERIGVLVSRQNLYGAELLTFSPWLGFLAGLLLALLAALAIGYPALRLKGHFLAMATLGFGLIIYRVLLGSDFTGGADGVTSVPPWNLGFGLMVTGRRPMRVQNYYLAWGLALVILPLLLNLLHSRQGRAWKAIHGGELAASAMGVNTSAYKLKAFVLSALIASAAGSLLTHYSGGIGPSESGALKSVRYVALVAAGGMANLWGAVLVSAVLNFLSLRGFFGSFDHAVFGLLLIIIISFSQKGSVTKCLDVLARPLRLCAGWRRRPQGAS